MDRKGLAYVRAAATILAGEDAAPEALEIEFLGLYLHHARYRAPLAASLTEFVGRLVQAGWAAPSPFFLPPQRGALFVVATGDGQVGRIGIVGTPHTASIDGPPLRDYFLAATYLPERGERIEVGAVSFWLIPPASG